MRIGLVLAERDTANRKPAGEARQRPQMPQQQTLIGLSSPALSVTVITALTAAPSYALHRPDLNHSKARGQGGNIRRYGDGLAGSGRERSGDHVHLVRCISGLPAAPSLGMVHRSSNWCQVCRTGAHLKSALMGVIGCRLF